MEQIDVAVVGGGVTGLAVARAIALRGLSACVLERHPRPGLDTSTHNSGVIHAGFYYSTGMLKARLCVEGRRFMYGFCAAHGVPHGARDHPGPLGGECGRSLCRRRVADVRRGEVYDSSVLRRVRGVLAGQ